MKTDFTIFMFKTSTFIMEIKYTYQQPKQSFPESVLFVDFQKMCYEGNL